LMKRVIDNTFSEEHKVTIGVENGAYIMKIDNKVIKLSIWDTVSTIIIVLIFVVQEPII